MADATNRNKQGIRTEIPFCFSGYIVLCLAATLYLSHIAQCAHDVEHSHISTRAAAVTTAGTVKQTVSGGSRRNVAITSLASVQDMAAMQSDLSQLDRLIKELGMTFYLEQSRDMTMFMPVDKAFDQLPFNIHELSWQAKWRIVQFHIIPHDVIDLDNVLKSRTEAEFESWEGAKIKVTKKVPEPSANSSGRASVEYIVNDDAHVVSQPPRIETFNGASYKINKVLLPPSMTDDDLKPAHTSARINPEVAQRLRGRSGSSSRLDGTPSVAEEQRLATVDGTVNMQRAAHDPRLPGSFRPDPLVMMSQETPDFLKNINRAHSRWDDTVYHRTPNTRSADQTKPQDETMGFHEQQEEEEASARIKVLGHQDGAVLPSTSNTSAMTRISGTGPRPNSMGMTFESVENPESAPDDTVSHFVNILLGGVSPKVSQKPSQKPASQGAATEVKNHGWNAHGDNEPSLFSMDFHPTEAPRVQALGLADGLLPSEELITEHWSTARADAHQRGSTANAIIAGQGIAHPPKATPITALWRQIGTSNNMMNPKIWH